jgi:TP901 family phage tail tape measure protein
MADVGSLRVLISAVDKTSAGLATAQASISSFVNQNKLLMMGMGTAILGAFAMAAKASADFDQALSRVTMTMNDAGVSANLFKTQINEMVKSIPKSADELGAAAYQIVQGGIRDTAQAMQVLEASSKLSTVAMSDTAETAAFLTSVMDMFDISGANAEKTANTLFKAINAGESNLSDFAAGFAKLGPLAANMGVSLEEVAGVFATLTAAEIPSFEASMALKGMLADLASISPKTAAAAKAMGVEFSYAALQSKGLSQFLMDIGTATQGDEQKLAVLFPSIKQFNSLLALTKPEGEKFKATMNAVGGSLDSLGTAFDTASGSMQSQFTLLKNEFDGVAREVGDIVIPILRQILPVISSIVRAFADMPPFVRALFTVFGLVAGAGLILIPVTATLVKSMTTLAGAFGLVAATAPAAATGIGAVAAISTSATVGTATFATTLGGVGVAGTAAGAGLLATLAPIALVAAAIGSVAWLVYEVGDTFDWWGEKTDNLVNKLNILPQKMDAIGTSFDEFMNIKPITVNGVEFRGGVPLLPKTPEQKKEEARKKAQEAEIVRITNLQSEMNLYQEQILQSASNFEYVDMIRYAGMDKITREKAQELALLQTQDSQEKALLQLEFDKMNAMFDVLSLDDASVTNKKQLIEYQVQLNQLKSEELDITTQTLQKTLEILGKTGPGISSISSRSFVSVGLAPGTYSSQTQSGTPVTVTIPPVQDFISRPGQPIQAISPQDTVVGVKSPNALSMFDSPAQGSSGKYIIENRIYLDGKQIAVAVGEHTVEDMSRRGR